MIKHTNEHRVVGITLMKAVHILTKPLQYVGQTSAKEQQDVI